MTVVHEVTERIADRIEEHGVVDLFDVGLDPELNHRYVAMLVSGEISPAVVPMEALYEDEQVTILVEVCSRHANGKPSAVKPVAMLLTEPMMKKLQTHSGDKPELQNVEDIMNKPSVLN